MKILLLRSDFEVFLPVHKVVRQWADRKKKLEVPLFHSYIFVKAYRNEIYKVLQIPGIVRNLNYNGAPAVLRASELNAINYWLDTGLSIDVESVDYRFDTGSHVRVLDGTFKGFEGKVFRQGEDVCYVIIDSLQQVLRIKLSKKLLSLIN